MKQGMLLILAVILVIFASAATDSASDDLQRMSGTWESHLLEAGGQEMPANERDSFKMKLVIQNANYAYFMEEKQFVSGRLVVDPSKTPHAIDAIPSEGPHRGKMQPGIYRFEGADLLFVFAEPGHIRPAEFKTKAGTNEMMILYKRVGK